MRLSAAMSAVAAAVAAQVASQPLSNEADSDAPRYLQDLEVPEANKSYGVKLKCAGCLFAVKDPNQKEKAILTLQPVPPYFSTQQLPANITIDQMNSVGRAEACPDFGSAAQEEQLFIEGVQIVKRANRVQSYRMKCGRLAMVQTSYDPSEWDEYGKYGTSARLQKLVFGTATSGPSDAEIALLSTSCKDAPPAYAETPLPKMEEYD
ncbi:hypothetical protein BDU57DRAFT_528225 [Ampelomyces quisqualis]|uniref:Uncharacterized protein n=1 Tax=Ampelomyces quisqualis TaxID=50730 RepID=A0A6A5QUN4_AMPQU|nr:hypothetical protein BDU57DRAFT_528225 [Ampelomyces quisqualis]